MNAEQTTEEPLFFRPGRTYVWRRRELPMHMLVLWSNGRALDASVVEDLGILLDGEQKPARTLCCPTRWQELA